MLVLMHHTMRFAEIGLIGEKTTLVLELRKKYLRAEDELGILSCLIKL